MTTATPPIRFYHTPWCPDCTRARRLLDEYGVAYDPINIATNAAAADFVCSLNHGCRSVPTLVFPDGTVLVEPSPGQLVDKLQQMELGQSDG